MNWCLLLFLSLALSLISLALSLKPYLLEYEYEFLLVACSLWELPRMTTATTTTSRPNAVASS